MHHDIWDYDDAAPPVLADIRYQGRCGKILMHAGKTGFLYILDRTNGKPLIGIEERPVPQEPRMKTAKTQPYPDRRFVRADVSRAGQRRAGITEQLHLRCVLDRAGRDDARHAGRTVVGAHDLQPADEPDLHPGNDHQLGLHAATTGLGREDAAVQIAR